MSSSTTTVPEEVRVTTALPSPYADQMPKLHRLAALPVADPRRAQLREQLILDFLPVVRNLAKRHSGGNPAVLEDLLQTGTIALIMAVDRWDPQRARGEFLGYLVPCVRGEMLRWFRDRTWAVTVPRRLKDLSASIRQTLDSLSQELGRAPRPSELAERLEVPTSEVIEALAVRQTQSAEPLDAHDPESGPTPVRQHGDVDPALDLVEYVHVLRPLLDALPARERAILQLRFYGDCTQTQIAHRLGMSQMHVSRLLTRTLQQLRTALTEAQCG